MSRDIEIRPRAVASPREALHRLLGRGSIYTLALVVQMLAAFLVIPVVTRLLTPSAYGQVAAAIVIYTVLSILGGAGLPDAVSRTYFASRQGPRAAQRLVVATLLIALALAVVCELTGPLWAPAFGLHYSGAVRLAVWSAPAAAVTFSALALLRAAERAWAFVAVAILGTLGGQAIALVLTALTHSPTGYMAGLAADAALMAVAGLVVTRAPQAGIAGRAELKDALALGLPIVPHGLSVYLVASADRIVIVSMLGLAAAGRYQVAYAIGGLGVALVTAVNQAWLPLVLGANDKRRWEILGTTSEVVYQFAAMIAIGIALAAPLALLIGAPASYGRAGLVPVCATVAFSSVPYAISGTYFQVVLVVGRTGVMALAAPLGAAVNIALNLVLLREIGLVGAAIATVAAYAVMPLVVAVRARRMVRIPGVASAAARACLLAAPFVVEGALLPAGEIGTWLRLASGLFAATICYRMLRTTIVARNALDAPRVRSSAPAEADGATAVATEGVVRAGS